MCFWLDEWSKGLVLSYPNEKQQQLHERSLERLGQFAQLAIQIHKDP